VLTTAEPAAKRRSAASGPRETSARARAVDLGDRHLGHLAEELRAPYERASVATSCSEHPPASTAWSPKGRRRRRAAPGSRQDDAPGRFVAPAISSARASFEERPVHSHSIAIGRFSVSSPAILHLVRGRVFMPALVASAVPPGPRSPPERARRRSDFRPRQDSFDDRLT